MTTPTCPRCEQLCEELSVQVSDQIDPSVNVPWMRGSPDLPKYIFDLEVSDLAWHRAASMLREEMGLPDGTDLYECLQKHNELKTRCSELEAQCAEMRSVIAEFTRTIGGERMTCLGCGASLPGHYNGCLVSHSLSSDCGKDYVPRKELDAAKAEVARLRSICGWALKFVNYFIDHHHYEGTNKYDDAEGCCAALRNALAQKEEK